ASGGQLEFVVTYYLINGDLLTLANLNLQKGIPWRFGPAWPGQRCGAKTCKGTFCQKPAYKRNDPSHSKIQNAD
ncbi:hypothetical protein N9X05_14705, partial [Paracoccaceae bacterium]|nr:hypothetical protein [Paracoccaceae bacterium]